MLARLRIRNITIYKAAVKKIENDLIRKAEKLKATFQSAQNMFSEIMRSIGSDANWDWAKTAQREKLVAASDKIRTTLSTWQKTWLLSVDAFSNQKANHGKERWEPEFNEFLKLDGDITALTNLGKQTLGAHALMHQTP